MISKNSVRRKEVLREISTALNRVETDAKFRILFVVVGAVHPSWFANVDTTETKQILHYRQTVQFIQLDARGTISIAAMQNVMMALNGKMVYSDGVDFQKSTDYIFEAGMPEKVYDNVAENSFFRVHTNDLAPSTTFPFALDNQWLPEAIMDEDSALRDQFLRRGFESDEVRECMASYQLNNLILALIHSKQVIINRASFLNGYGLQGLYCEESAYSKDEKDAFSALLNNGSIVVFLYGDNEVKTYVDKVLQYSSQTHSVEEWNRLCGRVSMYCIRENWETPIDRHSLEFVKHCTTLAFNHEQNDMLASCFGFDDHQKAEFFTILKEIEMTVFLHSHILGTGKRACVKGYSRSSFYKNFIVADQSEEHTDPVLHCIFDEKKPFHAELKKIIDVYYNSMFAGFFNCNAMIPNDIRPEDTFIHQLYLQHGIKEISPEELEYAFSEFFKNDSILDVIDSIGKHYFLDSWSMEKVAKFRSGLHWREYVEQLKYITNGTQNWRVDFSEVENLVKLFATSVQESTGEEDPEDFSSFTAAYTFRICIGSKVLDVVCTKKVKKLKTYPGILFTKNQNILSVQFLIGDTTSQKNSIANSVFVPIKIFDGKTSYMGGHAFFEEICRYLTDQCSFMWI